MNDNLDNSDIKKEASNDASTNRCEIPRQIILSVFDNKHGHKVVYSVYMTPKMEKDFRGYIGCNSEFHLLENYDCQKWMQILHSFHQVQTDQKHS